MTWSTETFATNQNANAIRFGTLYNFRFDADQPPQTVNATVGYFKTGSPMMVAIQAPAGGDANANTYRHGNGNGNCHGHVYDHSATHTDTEAKRVAKASPNSGATPLAVLPVQ